MRMGILLLPMMLSATAAQAVERLNIATMSCTRVNAALKSAGSAILQYPSADGRVLRYDIYYGSRQSCPDWTTGVRASVPAADGSCSVIRCIQKTHSGRR